MNKAMLTVGIIMLSVISLFMINVISNYSTGSELDYYLLKETTEAAMIDSLDDTYYRLNGLLRIDREKFAENFLCRFADAVDNTREYKVTISGINEVPPKVTVRVDSNTVLAVEGQTAPISTEIDAILEDNYTTNKFLTKEFKRNNSTVGSKKEVKDDSRLRDGKKLLDTN